MSFLAPRARLAPRLWWSSRGFSSSPIASTSNATPDSPNPDATAAPPPVTELAPEPVDPSETQAAPLDPERPSRGGKGFRAWLATDGARFKDGVKGQTNWLGETVSQISCWGRVPGGVVWPGVGCELVGGVQAAEVAAFAGGTYSPQVESTTSHSPASLEYRAVEAVAHCTDVSFCS